MSVESQLSNFTSDFAELPRNMRIFSLSLRSLYWENAMGTASGSDEARKTARRINKIRDDTRKDAMVYVKGVLPLSTLVVRSIKEFFEYYEVLTSEEWRESLTDILDEVRGYRQCCTEIVRMHEKIMVPLKKRQGEAKVLLSELKDLTEKYKKRQKEFEAAASSKRTWGMVLAFVPGVNVIASPLLGISADSDLASAVAEEQQCKINEAAIFVVSEAMIPALSAFVDGLNAAAGFFSVIENEIASFQTQGEAAMENAKKLHYIMMKRKSAEIKESCKEFYSILPGVRTDLECIPEEQDDQNYVDKWLVKQQEEIYKKYNTGITAGLRKMMNHLTTKESAQHMIKEK